VARRPLLGIRARVRFNRPSDIVRIIHEYDEPNFGAMFDTCHAYGRRRRRPADRRPARDRRGRRAGLWREAARKINHIQLIDSGGSPRHHTSTRNPFFTGKVDFG
jgi:hypothetical protein